MSEHELLVARGTSLENPIKSSFFRKAKPPTIGDRYGVWNTEPSTYRLPGGSVLTFDLSRLTLDDYRQMRTHYQLNASLNVLLFLIAQADYYIYTEGQDKDPKLKHISDTLEEGIRRYWMPLCRAVVRPALWCGYAPTVQVYDINPVNKYYEIKKYKDLVPENTRVNWKETRYADGTAVKTYNGIVNSGKKIPVDNTLWYPLLMENGDYYGTKLLQSAFPSWFFSQLIHLYTNRYFERFGEPTALGRYPSDESVKDETGADISAREMMLNTLTSLRSRGVVAIPSDLDPEHHEPEWGIEYLESQMRGVDFDRYIARLDEEMSLALFTPVLMFRTGDTGSYNLGEKHMIVFQWMLNALVSDLKCYLDEYLVKRLHDINFSPLAPRSEIRFRTLGRLTDQGAQSVLQALIQNGGAKVTEKGLADLGAYLGVDLEYLTGEGAQQADVGPIDQQVDSILNEKTSAGKPKPPAKAQLVAAQRRLEEQVRRIYAKYDGHERENSVRKLKLGFKGAFVNEMIHAGATEAAASDFFHHFEGVIRDAVATAPDEPEALESIRNVYADYGISD